MLNYRKNNATLDSELGSEDTSACGRVVKSCKDLDSEPVTNNAFSCKTGHLAPVHYKRESYIQCLTSHGIWWPRKCCMVRKLMATRMVKITIEVEVARVPAVGAFSLMTPRFITAWRGASISSLSDIMISIFSPYTNTFSYHPHRPPKTTIPFLGTAWDNLLQHILL